MEEEWILGGGRKYALKLTTNGRIGSFLQLLVSIFGLEIVITGLGIRS